MILKGISLSGVIVQDILGIVTNGLYANYDAAVGISGSTFLDSSGNGHTATLFRSPTTPTVNGRTVLRLSSAASQYFVDTVGYGADLNDAFTFDVWCCPLTGNSPGVLIAEWDNPNLDTGGWNDNQMGFADSTIQMGLYNTGYVTGPAWTLLNWYNIVMTYDGSTMSTYVNNAASGTTPGAKGSPSGTYLTMGAPANDYIGINNTPYFNGWIGAWKIYNRALAAAEVQQNYNALRGRYGV